MMWLSNEMLGLVQLFAFIISLAKSDTSMRSFCRRPPNFGKGEYMKDDNSCKITYNVHTKTKIEALEFCEAQNPYSLREAIQGPKTTCHISSALTCDSSETLIGELCFVYEPDTEHGKADERCKSISKVHTYSLHEITSVFEQKWIATFFSPYGLMWVANVEPASLLRAPLEGKVVINKEGRLGEPESKTRRYGIVVRKDTFFKAGVVVPVKPDTVLPLLCSRPGTPLPESHRYGQMGIPSFFYKDRSNVERPFTIIQGLHSFVIKDDYDAGTSRIHQSCEAFHHGYAATPYDFLNVNDFKDLLKKAKVNIVSVPGRMKSQNKLPNLKECSARDPRFKDQRTQFLFDLKKDKKTVIEKTAKEDIFWADGFPDRTCGDMPRVALAFTQAGLIDIPNIARHFVVCTFGSPPNVKPDDGSERCHAAADFINGQCKCKNEKDDIRFTKQFIKKEEDKNYAPGTLCVDCTRDRTFDVVIIFDHSSSSWRDVRMTTRIFVNFKIPLAAFYSHVRTMQIRENGLTHDSKRFFKGELDIFLKFNDEDYGIGDQHYEAGSGKPAKLRGALETAYTKIVEEPHRFKMIIMLMEGPPSDLKEAADLLKKLRQDYREYGHVETVVASKNNHKQQGFEELASAKEVYEIINEDPPYYALLSRIHHTMLRMACTT
uniref:EGF-like domain-containing protein n=1 Tax=Haemonchus contortus TaxID=6289 RepID=A0A7I4Y6D2_HAECO